MNVFDSVLLFPIIVLPFIFAFVSVIVWLEARRKERQAFYYSETLKKLAESTEAQARQVLEFMREEERNADQRRGEGMKLGGLIVTFVGVALIVMLVILQPHDEAWAAGLIPLLVGLALLLYAYKLAPRGEG